jgi:hypothetical protein
MISRNSQGKRDAIPVLDRNCSTRRHGEPQPGSSRYGAARSGEYIPKMTKSFLLLFLGKEESSFLKERSKELFGIRRMASARL